MVYKYLLTSGITTTKIEEYILDLFKLYLTVYPGDIPHLDRIGFNFLITGIMKNDLEIEIKTRVESLVKKISDIVPNKKYNISINTLDVIDEETVKLVLDLDGYLSEDIYINLYDENTEK